MRLYLFLLLSFTSAKSYTQLYDRCNEAIRGVGNLHQECSEDVLITSTEEEGEEGTIISGLITIEEAVADQYSIRIIPGYRSVRIVQHTDTDNHVHVHNHSHTDDHPYENDHHHTDERFPPKVHRTNIGNGGNTSGGGQSAFSSVEMLEATLNVYPNPTRTKLLLESTETKITSFQILDLQGTELKNISINASFYHTQDVHFLNTGTYLLKIKLENGMILSRLFLKI